MTARERVLAALNHEEVDFPPVYAFVESNTLYDHFAPDEPDLLKAAAVVHRELQVDVTYLVRRPPPAGVDTAGEDHRVVSQTTWSQKAYRTMADAGHKRFGSKLLTRASHLGTDPFLSVPMLPD